MGASIAHRGPDAEGFWAEPGVGLVHRRLSIIDLAGGDQPIGNEDGSIQVVFNGEIYNYQDLRAGWRPGATASAPGATPRSWSTSTRRKATAGRAACAACSPSPSGTGGEPPAAPGPRPAGHQAALRLPRRGEAALRLRAQGDPGPPRRERERSTPRRWRTTSPSAWSPGRESIFRGIEKLPPAHVLIGPGAELDRPPGATGRPAHRAGRPAHRGGLAGGGPGQGGRDGAAAPDRRRAGRRVPQRRHRLQRRGGLLCRRDPGAAPDLLDRLPRGVVQRTALRPPGGRAVRHPARRGDRHAGRGVRCSTN